MRCTASTDGVQCDLDADDVDHFRYFEAGSENEVPWVLLAVHWAKVKGKVHEWPEAS